MTEPLRPLNMGGILDRAIQGYREKFSLFAGLAVFPGLTQLAVGLAAVHPKTTTDPSGGHIALVIASYLASLVFTIANLVIQAIAMAAMCLAASETLHGKSIAIRTAFGAFTSRAGRLVGLEFLQGFYAGWPIIIVAVIGGVVAAAASSPYLMVPILAVGTIPSVALYVRCALATPACAIEDLPATTAFGRGVKLSEEGRWRICGGIFFPAVAAIGFTVGWNFVIAALQGTSPFLAGNPLADAALTGIVTLVADLIFLPISAIVLTVLYYDQRIRREGYDIERMMDDAGLIAPVPPLAGDSPTALGAGDIQ